MPLLPFDSILVKKAGGHNMVSIDEWLNIPLPERIELISTNKVQFLKGDIMLSAIDALKAIKQYKKAA